MLPHAAVYVSGEGPYRPASAIVANDGLVSPRALPSQASPERLEPLCADARLSSAG